jgi:hypothetical protein
MEFMSTRLFPKNLGADKYIINGIAGKCDWVILSDRMEPLVHMVKNKKTFNPKSVYLSLRDPVTAISHFVKNVLPNLNSEFILFTGSEDITIPNQLDKRWKEFSKETHNDIRNIINNKYVKYWFCENLDEKNHPKIYPIPLGMVYPNSEVKRTIESIYFPPLNSRPLKVLCAHRVRTGKQWEMRKQITSWAKEYWGEFCTVIEHDVAEDEFLRLVKEHTFVLCAEGGGIDPSPKAWQSILHGAIPIIRETALKSAYSEFPVMFVPDWCRNTLTLEKLKRCYADYSELHANVELNDETLYKLSLDYWWQKAMSSLIYS